MIKVIYEVILKIGASDKVNAEIDYIDVDRFMVDESDDNCLEQTR